MKVLIDANVALDVLWNRERFQSSLDVWQFCESGVITGYISALSVANMVYIMRKELNPEKIQILTKRVFSAFSVAALRARDLKLAAEMGFTDFEDALQSVCAARVGADYIVTRNTRDFAGSVIPAIEPSALLKQISAQIE